MALKDKIFVRMETIKALTAKVRDLSPNEDALSLLDEIEQMLIWERTVDLREKADKLLYLVLGECYETKFAKLKMLQPDDALVQLIRKVNDCVDTD